MKAKVWKIQRPLNREGEFLCYRKGKRGMFTAPPEHYAKWFEDGNPSKIYVRAIFVGASEDKPSLDVISTVLEHPNW